MCYIKGWAIFAVVMLILGVVPYFSAAIVAAEKELYLFELRDVFRDLYPLADESTVLNVNFDDDCNRNSEDLNIICQQYEVLDKQGKLALAPLIALTLFPLALMVAWLLSRINILIFPYLFVTLHKFLMAITWGVVCAEVFITVGVFNLTTDMLAVDIVWGLAAVFSIVVTSQLLAFYIIKRKHLPLVEGESLSKDAAFDLWYVVESVANSVKSNVPDRIIIGDAKGFFVTRARYRDDHAEKTGLVLYCSIQSLCILDKKEIYALIYREMRGFKRPSTCRMTALHQRVEVLSQCLCYKQRVPEFIVELFGFFIFSLVTYMCSRLFERRLWAYKLRRQFIADMSSCMHVSKEQLVQALVKIYCLDLIKDTPCGEPISIDNQLQEFFSHSSCKHHDIFHRRIARLSISLSAIRSELLGNHAIESTCAPKA